MAFIHKIIPFSCVDGPGNRMALFFQGCSFQCDYCHNPETIPLSSPDARDYSVEELMQEIRATAPFLRGITCSGGECTLQAEFLTELFRTVKKETELTCLIDTNGAVLLSAFPDLVEVCDGFMLDVKAWDEDIHRRMTGQSNKTVLDNLQYLMDAGKIYEVRTVILPDRDNEKTVREVSRIIGGSCLYKLIPYRPHGVSEHGLIVHGSSSPSAEEMDRYCRLALGEGARRVEISQPFIS